MDLSKLAMLKTESLREIQQAITKILADRLDTTPRVGRRATFDIHGTTRTVMIEKVNPKTIVCAETTLSVEPGKRWKVHRNLLKVEPVERPVRTQQPPTKPTTSSAYRPMSDMGDAW